MYPVGSITAKHDLEQGKKIQLDDILIERPADGIEPKYITMIIGKTLNTNIKKDTAISWSHIS